jgi:hypothetical protein
MHRWRRCGVGGKGGEIVECIFGKKNPPWETHVAGTHSARL